MDHLRENRKWEQSPSESFLSQKEIARAGIDKGCEEFWYNETRWGKLTQVRGVRCEKLDGSWEILNINGTVK